MEKVLGCGLAGIAAISIWIITFLAIEYLPPLKIDYLALILIGIFSLGLIPIFLWLNWVIRNKDSKKHPTLICGKCNNKSTDFDGLFCPNCGAKFSTKTKDDDEFGLF